MSDRTSDRTGSDEEHDATRRYVLVPQELRNRPQWVGFRRSVRHRRNKPDEITKQPVNARTGALCAVTDPTMWSSFDAAVAGAIRSHLDGIGFCFSPEDPYTGIDLDHCRDLETGELTPWACELVALLDSYSEISPSGSGVHVVIKAVLPADAGHKRHYHDGAVEIYSAGRFFTVTGAALDDVPLLILERQDALEQLRQRVWRAGASRAASTAVSAGVTGAAETAETAASAAASAVDVTGTAGERELAPPTCGVTTLSDDDVLAHCRSDATGAHFCAVYDDGDLTDDAGDDSRADFFIWSKLAFYIGNDPARIARLAEAGAHYRHPEDPAEAAARQRKWQRPYPPFGTFQQRQIAVTLAGRGDDAIFGGGLDAHDVVFVRGTPDIAASPSSQERVKAWPAPLAAAGYYGVLGEIARGVERFIEADSAALLVNLLVASGIAIGRENYLQVGAAQHHPVLYAVTCGEAAGNKSDATTPLRALLAQAAAGADDDGMYDLVSIPPALSGGLSTGEGLLWQVRDERREQRENKKTHVMEEVVVDVGVSDKRLIVVEAEFARVLAVMYREGNTLSTVLRDLYDSPEQARTSPKNSPVVSTRPHVGLIGQITPTELRRKLHETELFNGFVSRFLWVLTHRVKSLPAPPDYSELVQTHAQRWRKAIRCGRTLGEIRRDDDATIQWRDEYERLRSGDRDGLPPRHGMALEACARAHVMVLRIALIFAALDGSPVITTSHQDAALAVWDYCERCAAYLFSDLADDPVENVLAEALRTRGRMRREELRALFGRHLPAEALQLALTALEQAGKVRQTREQTGGRPGEYWEWVAS